MERFPDVREPVRLPKFAVLVDIQKNMVNGLLLNPQILHLKSYSIPRALRFFETGRILDITCQTKCLNFGEHCNFHEKAKRGLVSGP